MSLKQFFITISLLPTDKLKDVWYHEDGSDTKFEMKCSYPSIPLIGNNIEAGDEIEIIPIRVADKEKRSEKNYEKFKNELQCLLNGKNVRYTLCEEIKVADEETRSKQIETFKAITARFESGAKVYADITYGTKPMPIIMLSALNYADSFCDCSIKKITYGRFLHTDSDDGTLYDVRSLFEISSMISTMKHIDRKDADRILDSLWR